MGPERTFDYKKFRYPGEFEPRSDVFLAWIPDYVEGIDYRKACAEVIKALIGHVNVHINCGNQTNIDGVKSFLSAAGIDCTSTEYAGQRCVAVDLKGDGQWDKEIHFHQIPDWCWWLRDSGPDIMVDGEGGMAVVNNEWSDCGCYDKYGEAQQLTRRASLMMAISVGCNNIINTDLVTEGGDRESNGKGVLMCVEDTEVKRRNPEYTKEQIENEFKRIYNVEKVIWIPQPLAEDSHFLTGPLDYLEDGTPLWTGSIAGHIDEMCRFVSEDTVLLAEVTEEEAASNAIDAENYTRLEEAYEILSRETTVDGKPFKILRIPVGPQMIERMPKDQLGYEVWKAFFDEAGVAEDGTPWYDGDFAHMIQTGYCNFLICNDIVLGQHYWRPGMDESIKERDEKARKALQEAFPDREIITVDAFDINVWSGGIHCWTKDIPSPYDK